MHRPFILGALMLQLLSGEDPALAGQSIVVTPGANPSLTGVYHSTPLRALEGARWEYKTEGDASGTVVVSDGAALFGCAKGILYAVDAGSGELRWTFDAGSKLYNAPAVLDDTACLGCSNGFVYAVNVGTGKEVWKFETGGGICFPPALNNGVAYACSHDNSMYLIDIASGTQVGRIEEQYALCCTPSIHNGVIYYPDWGGNLHALIGGGNEKAWSVIENRKSKWFAAPSIAGGTAYFVKFDSTLAAIDVETGRARWTFEADGVLSRTPAVKDNIVVFTSVDSHVYALDASNGKPMWNVKRSGTVYSRVAITGDVAYVGSGDHHLYAHDLASGAVLWKFEAEDAAGSPTPDGGRVYFTSGRTVHALE
jgi:outer membrane protein assembly factor BamB